MLKENEKPIWQRFIESINPLPASAATGLPQTSNLPMIPQTQFSSQYMNRSPQNTQISNSYITRPKDTLWGIAERTLGSGTRYKELGGYTGQPTQLPVGQRLTIPQSKPTFTPQMSRNLPMTPVSQNRPQYSTQPKTTYQTPKTYTPKPVPTPAYQAPKQSRQPMQSTQPKKTNLLDAIIGIFRNR